MAVASPTLPRRDSTNSTAGAINDDSVTSARRRPVTSLCRTIRGSLSDTIDGCSAAPPQPA